MKKQLDNQDSLRGCVLDMLHAVREAQLVLTMSAPPTECDRYAI